MIVLNSEQWLHKWKLIGMRIRGRPRKRWVVDIEEDKKIMGIKRWRKQCKERAEWKRLLRRLKPIVGCNASKRKRRRRRRRRRRRKEVVTQTKRD
jgi:hypothetical protein